MLHRCRLLVGVSLLLVLAVACRRDADSISAASTPKPTIVGASTPAEAVLLLTADLRGNDLDAFARHAVPRSLQPALEQAWREGRTRWPLDELPFDDRLPNILQTLSAPTAEAQLRATFRRQFANAGSELRAAARGLGQFGVQYVQRDTTLSAGERAHHAQLIRAASQWAWAAPLTDAKRADAAIQQLCAAARKTGLQTPEQFAGAGMQTSLRQIGPFIGAFKDVLADYGLDIDAGLAGQTATVTSQQDDTSIVEVRYTFAGQPIIATVPVVRVEGHWYVRDFLDHARAAVAVPAPPPP